LPMADIIPFPKAPEPTDGDGEGPTEIVVRVVFEWPDEPPEEPEDEPRSFAEADRAGLGLLWLHRQQFVEDVAVQAFTELFGKPPAPDELRNERSRWVLKLMSYPAPLREAIATNCEPLYEVGDASCPTPPGAVR